MTDRIDKLIMLLSKAMANRKLYHSDHPRVDSYLKAIIDLLSEYFAETEKNELFIGVIEGNFIFEGKRLFGSSVTGKQLLDFIVRLGCGGFGLQRGMTVKELKNFLDISALRTLSVKQLIEARTLFAGYGISHLRIADPYSDQDIALIRSGAKSWEGQAIVSGLGSPVALYQSLYEVVSNAHGAAATGRGLDIDNARSVSEAMLAYTRDGFSDVLQQVLYPDYDSYTVGHCVRVASLSVYLGTKMNWKKKELLAVGTAALLHDIGKATIPDEILLKKGKLTDSEFAIIKEHPQRGVELLLAQPHISSIDLSACWGHHIRHDGGGYPRQPKWATRHPITMLMQICDVFEALTAVRPYKPAMEPQQAYKVMIEDKGGFHPGMLAAFIAFVGLYPPGNYVKLSDGRTGFVTEVGNRVDRPKVLVTKNERGYTLDEDLRYSIDLSDSRMSSVSVDHIVFNHADGIN